MMNKVQDFSPLNRISLLSPLSFVLYVLKDLLYLDKRADIPNEINLFEARLIVGDPTARSTAKLFLKA